MKERKQTKPPPPKHTYVPTLSELHEHLWRLNLETKRAKQDIVDCERSEKLETVKQLNE